MSDFKLERKETLTRAEAAKRLAAFAEAVAAGGELELDLGGTSLSMRIDDSLRAEFEVEIDGDEIEVEIELKWSTAEGKAEDKGGANHATGTRRRGA